MMKREEIKVFISNREEAKCDDCGEELGRKAWITLDREKGALCLIEQELHVVAVTSRRSRSAAYARQARMSSSVSSGSSLRIS